MKKLLSVLALLLTAALLFAACGEKTEPANTDEDKTSDVTTTAFETAPPEPTTAIDQSTANPGESTTAPDATTEVTAPPIPQGKKEILAAYTKVVDKVKIDRPEYMNNDWQTMSNVDMSGIVYGPVSLLAKSFLETKEESTPGKQGKGNHPKWFALPTAEAHKVGCILTDTSKIESASCTKSGDYYVIKITLVQETDPAMVIDNPYAAPGWHGKMFDVIDITQVTDYAKKAGIKADNAYCTFKGTATLKYNPVTDECVALDHIIDVRVHLGSGAAKVIADYHFYDFKW